MHLLLLQVTAQHHLHDIAVQNNCQVHDVLDKVGDLALPQEPKMFPPGISGLQNNSCLCLLYSVSGLHLPGHSHSFDTVFIMSGERRAEERTYRKRPSSQYLPPSQKAFLHCYDRNGSQQIHVFGCLPIKSSIITICGLVGGSVSKMDFEVLYIQAMPSGKGSLLLLPEDQDVELKTLPAPCLHACCHDDNGQTI